MIWRVVFTVIALGGGLGILVNVNRLRSERRIANEVRALHHGSCPLTAMAARYTDDRRDDFDIHLPERLARNNKLIFGALYLAGLVFALTRDLLFRPR